MFETYPKINPPFVRDEKTKRLIKYKWLTDEFAYLNDLDWMWTEKVDGTGIRVIWDGYTVSFAGRKDGSEIPSHLLKYLENKFGGAENEGLFEQKFGNKNVILFGEGYGSKINSGEQYRDDVSFILFDVEINGLWLSRAAVSDIANYFSTEIVPRITSDNGLSDVDWAMDYVMSHPKSRVAKANGKDCYMEGLVGTPMCGILTRTGERIQMKVKWHDFRWFTDAFNT